MDVYLRAKFEVSRIILTSFRQGVILPAPPQNELLKSPPRLGLTANPTNCLSVFDHSEGLALKGLTLIHMPDDHNF